MENTIYYFSGTGNSLKMAKDIANRLQNSELISMAANMDKASELTPQGAAGFVFPVYHCGLPRLVEEFISSINLTNAGYIYIVCTYGSTGGNAGCISQMRRICRSKGAKLNAAFYVKHVNNFMLTMWDNFPWPAFEVTQERNHAALHESAYKRAKHIAEVVSARKNYFDRSIIEHIAPIVVKYRHFYNTVKSNDKAFYCTDSCTYCGLCADVCPTSNIDLDNGRPAWKSETCQRCLACLHLCPPASVQYGSRTLKYPARYRNPYITVEELKRASQQQK